MIAIYARQSIERPDSVSIDTQIQQCNQSIQGDSQVYADAGYSGKDTKRPEFERMVQDIKAGKIKAVVSYRLDRVSRNIVDFANLLKFFEKFDVKYISATEQFDTSTPMGRAMIYIVMVFAQLERETIATRILDNYRFRSAQGLFMGGNTPFGYSSRRMMSENGKKISVLEPNDQANLLQNIFDRCISKESLFSICHELNQRGLKTARGNFWTSNAVKRILQNISPCCADERLYEYLILNGYNVSNNQNEFDGQHGMCLFFKNKNRNQPTGVTNQIAVVGLHKPLISSEQFIQVQQILNAASPVRGKRSKQTFLAGMLKCKECGYSFGVKYTQKNGRDYAYYRCRGRETRGICNNSVYIPAHELETNIIRRCKSHITRLKFSTVKVQTQENLYPFDKVEQLKTQIQNLIDNIGKGNAVVDNLLTQKITNIQEQIDKITSNAREPESATIITDEAVNWLANQLDRFSKLDAVQKTDVIRNIIKTVMIDKDGKVEIEYLF